MPCLVIVGHPSAGKTTIANLLKERALLHDAIDDVVLLNEETECGCIQTDDNTNERLETSKNERDNKVTTTKQELYENSLAEKQTRGALKASFDRAVKKSGGTNSSNRRLVILDSLNYIKGFRYELHCISKAAGEKHGILWVLNRLSVVEEWNKDYSPPLLQELISRFEPPDNRNRWDKPLFTIDVEPTSVSGCSTGTESNLQTRKTHSSKNEVLEHSVYNMHSLGEAFGTSRTKEQTDNNTETQQSKKSAFSAASNASKAPKKSAFRRRKKASPPSASEKNEKKIASVYNQNNKIIFDTSMMDSSAQDGIIASEKPSDVCTSKSALSPGVPQQSIRNEGQTSDGKSLEEKLDEILDIFLLQTKNLKEGMSTRQYD